MLRLNSKFHLLVTPLFTILLTNPGIASADAGTLQFDQATFNVHENDKTATIEVTRSGGSDGKVSVKCATSDGTATAGSDYQAISGKLLKWADGDTAPKTCNVKIINDKVFNEGYETANLTLSEPTGGAVLGTPNAILRIADNDCGTDDPDAPNPHWVDTCPSGNDEFPSTAIVNIAFGASCFLDDASGIYEVKLKGPAKAFRKDGTPHTIETEMYDMQLTGTTPFGSVTLRAGDGVGNREHDGPLYSPGEINEQADPGKADSYFNMLFEINTPFGTLHNQTPFIMEGHDLLKVPPTPMKRKDGTIYTVTYLHPSYSSHIVLMLYNASNQPTACFKVKEIGKPVVRHNPDVVELSSFTAVANNQEQVSIAWETGTEENNAAFRVSRGIPSSGICSTNPNDYAEITQVTPLIPSKGTEMSGAVYSITDSNVISGTTYCYVLEDIDYDNKSTFHTDQLVSVTVN